MCEARPSFTGASGRPASFPPILPTSSRSEVAHIWRDRIERWCEAGFLRRHRHDRVNERNVTPCETPLTHNQADGGKEGEFPPLEKKKRKRTHLIIFVPPQLALCLFSQVSLCNPRQPATDRFTRCYDLLNRGTLKYSSPAQRSTEAKFLPGIIKVNRILMGPGRPVKTLSGAR